MRKSVKALLAAAIGAASIAAISTGASASDLNGAGSSAIYPVLNIWAQKYEKETGIKVNYQPIGSGGGIKAIESKTVDFGASDKPLVHADITANNLFQFPQVIISIVPVINVPGIKAGELVLDGKTVADIFLGKIAKWNDPEIQALNPKVKLPNLGIIVVHRSDGSGTTFNWVNYLGKVSPEWESSVNKGGPGETAVTWPADAKGRGNAGKGNAGVAGAVAQVVGSIGYVEFAYAKQNNMTYTDMINSAGKRVAPVMSAFQSAGANADFSKVQDYYLVLTDQPGDASWPVTGTTWVIMRTDYDAARNQNVVKFFDWCLRHGQAQAESLDYVPLPDNVVSQIEASWKTTLKVSP